MNKDIKVAPLTNSSWAANIPGMFRCYIFPVIACDRSNGPNKGTIYITWFDKNKDKLSTSIWISKSTDEGSTWSKPQEVNSDSTSRYQYFPWISIDQTNGNIYIAYYYRLGHNDKQTDLFMARSMDGGMTFTNFKVTERPFTPNEKTFMGDYIGMSVYNNIVRPIWTVIDDHSRLSVWTAIINLKAIK
jgi:Neuraminidase (sialidase)